MKKLIALLLVACMCLPVFGCQGEPATATEPPVKATDPPAAGETPAAPVDEPEEPLEPCTITIWVTYSDTDTKKAWWESAIDKFEAENPGVKVELQGQGGYDGVAEKLLAGAAAKSLPTLAMIEESFITMFNPIAEDLSKYISQETIDNYIDGLMATSYYDGVLMAVPFSRSTPAFYYNKDMFKELGLPEEGPKTWDDVYEYAKVITASGTAENPRYGFAGNWDTDCWRWESVLASTGDTVCSADGKQITFNTDGGKYIIKLWQTMILEGVMQNPYLGKDVNPYADFAAGKAGMYFDSTGKYGTIVESKTKGELKFDLSVCLQPMVSEELGYGLVSGGANMMMCKSASEAEKIAAGKLLEFMARDEYASGYFIFSGYMATTESSLEYGTTKDRIEKDPNYRTILQQLDYVKARPLTPQWREIYTMLYQYLQQALIDPTLDVDAMMTEAAGEAQKILDRG